MAPGAFFVLAILAAIQNKLKAPGASNVERKSDLACGGNCDGCVGMACALNRRQVAEQTAEKARQLAEERARLAAEKKAAKEQEGGEQA
jgi:electron transport complex protein RnfE